MKCTGTRNGSYACREQRGAQRATTSREQNRAEQSSRAEQSNEQSRAEYHSTAHSAQQITERQKAESRQQHAARSAQISGQTSEQGGAGQRAGGKGQRGQAGASSEQRSAASRRVPSGDGGKLNATKASHVPHIEEPFSASSCAWETSKAKLQSGRPNQRRPRTVFLCFPTDFILQS